MELLLPAALGLFQMLCVIDGYPNGAPTGACEDMLPRHSGVSPQVSASPHIVVTDARTFQPGTPITVTIRGPQYRGVLLQARTDGSTEALGTWQLPPPDTKFLQCAGNPQGAVTHSNTNLKGNTTVYSWMPPDSSGPIHFMATVAEQRTVFWVNVRSLSLTRGKPAGLDLATGGSGGAAEEKPLLLFVMCFLILQVLG